MKKKIILSPILKMFVTLIIMLIVFSSCSEIKDLYYERSPEFLPDFEDQLWSKDDNNLIENGDFTWGIEGWNINNMNINGMKSLINVGDDKSLKIIVDSLAYGPYTGESDDNIGPKTWYIDISQDFDYIKDRNYKFFFDIKTDIPIETDNLYIFIGTAADGNIIDLTFNNESHIAVNKYSRINCNNFTIDGLKENQRPFVRMLLGYPRPHTPVTINIDNVTVKLLNNEAKIKKYWFSKEDNQSIDSDINGLIENDKIIIPEVEIDEVVLRKLKARFELSSDAILIINDIEQKSGVTVNDFSNLSIYYNVISEDKRMINNYNVILKTGK